MSLDPRARALMVGEPYPLSMPDGPFEGAAAQLLTVNGHYFQIMLNGIAPEELRALSAKGKMEIGMYRDGITLLLLISIEDGLLTFDCPFDCSIPADLYYVPEWDPDTPLDEQRLLTDMHVIEMTTRRIVGLRSITLPPVFTRLFIDEVESIRETMSDLDRGEIYALFQTGLNRAMQHSTNQLITKTKMYTCGI